MNGARPPGGGGNPRVALIDDYEGVRDSVSRLLRLHGYAVEVFDSADAAWSWPGLFTVDCVVTDVRMPGLTGEALLGRLAARPGAPPVVVITAYGDAGTAVRCLKAGARQFLEKPLEEEALLAAIREATAGAREREKPRGTPEPLPPGVEGRHGMVGRCGAMVRLYEGLESAAISEAPVLITGEEGSGRRTAARALHGLSRRSTGPLTEVDGARAGEALDALLFGRVGGAVRGRGGETIGRIARGAGGTLVVVHVEKVPARVQRGFLRVLDEGVYFPLGSDAPQRAEVRFVATAAGDLDREVREGRVREDFYHRIAVLSLRVPALRERRGDIPWLVESFLRGRKVASTRLPERAWGDLLRHPWPGNVRELRAVVEAMAAEGFSRPARERLPADEDPGHRHLSLPSTPGRLRCELERTEKRLIEEALAEAGGEILAASRILGISRRTLYERMALYELGSEGGATLFR